MKYGLLLFCLALVSCVHPRPDSHGGEAVQGACTHGAAAPQRISPSWGDPLKLKIDPTRPPDGMHLIQILLENQSLSVKGTQCESDPLGFGDKRLLLHTLAMTLGYGLDNPLHRAELLGSCQPNQYDLPAGGKIDAWQCRLTVMNKDEEGYLIASSNIYFGITKDTWEFVPVPEALVCW